MNELESRLSVGETDRPGMEMRDSLVPTPGQGKVINAVDGKMKRAMVDEETFQEMVEDTLPLQTDLQTVADVIAQGGYKEKLKAAEVSLRLKRRLSGDGMQVTINTGSRGTPEDLQNMLSAVGGLLPKAKEAKALPEPQRPEK